MKHLLTLSRDDGERLGRIAVITYEHVVHRNGNRYIREQTAKSS